jgi:hypothetical protein
MDQILEDLYYNPKSKSAFSSIAKLYSEAKKLNKKISKNYVKTWLSGQQTYTLFKDRRIKNYPRWKYFVFAIDQQWSIDLADMQAIKDINDGYSFLLCVVDIFSKFAWCKPVKSKVKYLKKQYVINK